MRIGVLGTGAVGRALSNRFAELGHEVVVGTRDVRATLEKDSTWADELSQVSLMTMADAAAHGEVIVNATSGGISIAALTAAGAANLDGKVLIDVANALDFSHGFPPSLIVKDTDSLAERIQREFPAARVVKTLNTVANEVMVNPGRVGGGDHTIFVSGDDLDAKTVASGLLREMGWSDIVDLGNLSTARGPEMWLALWVRLFAPVGHPFFNIKLVR